MNTKLITPTVHLNGTCGKDLLEQVINARNALRLAIKALGEACPNGRDYYLQGGGVIQEALEQHQARQFALGTVYCELGQIAEAIVDQEV